MNRPERMRYYLANVEELMAKMTDELDLLRKAVEGYEQERTEADRAADNESPSTPRADGTSETGGSTA